MGCRAEFGHDSRARLSTIVSASTLYPRVLPRDRFQIVRGSAIQTVSVAADSIDSPDRRTGYAPSRCLVTL